MTEPSLKEVLDNAERQLDEAGRKLQITLLEEENARHDYLICYSNWVLAGRPE